MQGGDFVELPDEVKESIRRLLEYVHQPLQPSGLLNPIQGTEEDVPGFLRTRGRDGTR